METIRTGYRPLPKQDYFHRCEANEILFGGAAGGAKSHGLRQDGLDWCLRIPGLQVYLFRRTFPELEKNHIISSLNEFPQELGKYNKQSRRWEFNNGSMLHFCHCQYEQDVFQYQGAEIHVLLIDELTTFTEFQYDYLRARVRCTLPIEPQYRNLIPRIACASNPGGIGHNFVKDRWIKFAKPMELKRAPVREGGMVRCYIPSRLQDNPILTKNDPGYINRLDALPEPYRTAYKEGNWDIFIGQAFEFSDEYHVIDPIPIPENAPIYTTYDWGFGAPFSWGWWWVDNDGRTYRFAEWYGWNGEENKGIRYEDSRIAEEIIRKELQLESRFKVKMKAAVRIASPDCWNKKPDYKGGGQGPSTAEEFAKMGLYLTKADPSRELKIRQFRERIKVPRDANGKQISRPMMQVYEDCEQFIRTIKAIQMDPKNPEYIIDDGETHCFDDSCQLLMARPIGMKPKPTIMTMAQARIDAIERPPQRTSEDQLILETIESQRFWDRLPEIEDIDRPHTDYHYGDVG